MHWSYCSLALSHRSNKDVCWGGQNPFTKSGNDCTTALLDWTSNLLAQGSETQWINMHAYIGRILEEDQFLFLWKVNLMQLITMRIRAQEKNVYSCKLNSLWPSDAILRHRSGSTLVQIMACCLTAPSHYLNLCWLISTVKWHSSKGKFTRDDSAINHWNYLEN